MNIVLIGIQGCGKGTLVAQLEKEYDLSLISMGQLLRDEIATGSKLGQEIKAIIDKGNLVSLDIIKRTLGNKLEKSNKELTVFDGFPRNMEQADLLDSISHVDLVIHLELSKDVALSRILNRLTCSACAYITKKQAVSDNTCPHCGGKLITRSDDTTASINKRFELYHNETYPLLERYRTQGLVVDINANQSPDKVFEEVLKVINEYNYKK